MDHGKGKIFRHHFGMIRDLYYKSVEFLYTSQVEADIDYNAFLNRSVFDNARITHSLIPRLSRTKARNYFGVTNHE